MIFVVEVIKNEMFKNKYRQIFFLWLTWILCGTAFYSYYCDFGIFKGIYMSINVGYSIGWGFPVEPDDNALCPRRKYRDFELRLEKNDVVS